MVWRPAAPKAEASKEFERPEVAKAETVKKFLRPEVAGAEAFTNSEKPTILDNKRLRIVFPNLNSSQHDSADRWRLCVRS